SGRLSGRSLVLAALLLLGLATLGLLWLAFGARPAPGPQDTTLYLASGLQLAPLAVADDGRPYTAAGQVVTGPFTVRNVGLGPRPGGPGPRGPGRRAGGRRRADLGRRSRRRRPRGRRPGRRRSRWPRGRGCPIPGRGRAGAPPRPGSSGGRRSTPSPRRRGR